tara:strand:+ start:55 stop:162 length:108 start_codon:yes stop_codon:yes gene_type:complete
MPRKEKLSAFKNTLKPITAANNILNPFFGLVERTI